MRAVVQRVLSAEVEVNGRKVGTIGRGLLVYLGVAVGDGPEDADWLARRVGGLRIFADGEGKLNQSIVEINGSALAISAFTVCGDARKGRRPSFDLSAPAAEAETLYQSFCQAMSREGVTLQKGVFGADMRVQSVNDGPVCLLLDSKRLF